MRRSEVEQEALEWHLDNAAEHRADRWADADVPDEDDDEEEGCPLCGRDTCSGYCEM